MVVAATLVFWLLFPTPAPAQTLSFAKRDFPVGSDSITVAVGDFNGDGVPDLVVANEGSNNVAVLLGNGDGTFRAAQFFPVGINPVWVVVGGFNGNRVQDLAVPNINANNISVLLGNGDGTFPAGRTFAVGSLPTSVTVGDFNGDGKLDLAAANWNSGDVSVLLGNGDGTFQPARTFPSGTNPISPAVGDFNRDGLPDLAVANYGNNNISVLLGNGDGTFRPAVYFPAGTLPSFVAVGQFNADGILDLAVTNAWSNDVSVLLGNGDGTFQAPRSFAVGSSPLSAAVADINGDGRLDLAVANYGNPSVGDLGNVVVLLGNGDGTFQPALPFTVGTNPESVVVGDFNRDGKLDLAVANFHSNSVSVLINTSGAPAPTYTLSASPSSVTVTQGSTGSSTITVSPLNGFTGSVTLSASGLPSGVTAAFSPNPTTTTSTLTLTANPTATTGTVTVTLTGTSGTLPPKTTTLTLTVNAQVAPTYTLSASPSSVTVTQGSNGTSTITVLPQNGFTGSVNLSTSSLPSGVTASFSPNPTTTTSTLTLAASPTATTGTVTVTITGNASGLTRTTTLTLRVTSVGVSRPVLRWQYGGCLSGPYCQTGWYSSPAVADLDGDGNPDVIWGAYDVVALNGADGSLKWRAPSGNPNRVWPGVVVADLTGNGTLEVVVARQDLTVYDRFGNVLWTRNPFPGDELRTLAVADLDNDGQLEIIVGDAGGGTPPQLAVFEPNGAMRPGWPAVHAGEPGFSSSMYNQNVAVADMNGDGLKEIFGATTGHYIAGLDQNGNQLTVNSVYAPRQFWSEVGVFLDNAVDLRGYANCGVDHRPNFQDSAPVIADVNGDGIPELIVVGSIYNCAGSYTTLYHMPFIFNLDRTRWSGSGFDWTVLPTPTPGSAPRSQDYNVIETVVPNPVVADLDGDGLMEIIYPSYDGRVHAYWLDKTEHGNWPYRIPTTGAPGDDFRFASEPIVVDLDNDGHAEVIFTSWPKNNPGGVGQLHILNYLGVELFRVNLPAPAIGNTINGSLAAPTIAHLDGGPDFQLVVGTMQSGVAAFDLPNSANARILWGTGRGNYLRDGSR